MEKHCNNDVFGHEEGAYTIHIKKGTFYSDG